MDRKHLLVWLALFAAAVPLGLCEHPRPARPARRNAIDPRLVRVTVGLYGDVRVEGADGTDLVVGTLASDPVSADATLERLRAQLRRLTSGAPTDPTGYSLLTTDIYGPRTAPHRWFQWIAMVSNGSNIDHIQYHALEDFRDTALIQMGRPRKAQFDVLSWKGGCAVEFRLTRRKQNGKSAARTEIVVGRRERGASDEPREVPEEVIATIDSGSAGLSAWLSLHARDVSTCQPYIEVEYIRSQPTSSDEVRFGDMLDMIDVLNKFGFHPLEY